MKKSITKLIVCCALVGGITVPSTAQLQSKINFTLEQHAQIEALTKVYKQQGLDTKMARMKAEEKVAPEVVKLRVGNDGYLPTGSVARPDLTPWPVDHAAWMAASTYPGSIEVDRNAFIHTFKPSELVKKVLLKAYTPEDAARIQNVRFLGFNGLPGGGDDWQDNASLTGYGLGNRGLAYFTKGTSSFAIPKGLLLSTGETWGHEGPNELDKAICEGVREDGVTIGFLPPYTETYDDDLAHIAQQPVTHGGILEFDFCPAINQATFDYVFGSEEYPEFVHERYNDVFGFFVSGPYDTPNGTPTVGLPAATWERETAIYNGEQVATYNRYNIAQLPNGMSVGVDWTNWGWRNAYDIGDDNTAAAWLLTPADTTGLAAALLAQPPAFPDNLHGSGSEIAFNPEYHRAVPDGDPMMEMDGITIKLTALMDSLIPDKWYRLKIGIAQVDLFHGDGVFIGNLDLGQATSGIGNNHGWENWPAANDLLGVTHFYAGCADTLTIDFDPQVFPQYIEIIPRGALVGNLVDMEGNPLSLKDSLSVGQSRIVRIFQVSEDASFESGAAGWFESYSYDPLTHAGNPNPSNALVGDTTAVYNLYKRFTSDAVFNRPTTGYVGRLELNIKDGSPSLFRSVNGGITWENAYLPFRQSQLANLAEEDSVYIMLKEPNSCWNDTILLDSGTVPPIILRPVWMAEVPNAIVSCQWGTNHVISLQNFVFTITPTGANAGMAPVITTDRTSIPDSEGVTVEPNGDGSYTVTIYRVQEPIRVSIDFTTGNASIEDGNKIWSGNGRVYILSTTTGDATIYNVMGKLVNTVACLAGETVSAVLPSGFYIATLSNGHSYKVSVK